MTRMTFVILAGVGLVVWRFSISERPVRVTSAKVKPLSASTPAAPTSTVKTEPNLPAARPRLAGVAPEPPSMDVIDTLPGGVELISNWETLSLAKNPMLIEEWPGWKCADLADNTERSLWVREDATETTGEIHHGFCSEWAKRSPGDPSIWAPNENGEGYPLPGS